MFRPAFPLFRSPRRSFSRGRGVVLGVFGVSALVLSGCSTSAPTVSPVLTGAASAAEKQKSPRNSARKEDSLNAALAKIDGATVQAWFNRWTTPPGAQSAKLPQEVRIDTEVLARRHPAWQLAEALERGAISPAAPQIARVLAFSSSPSFSGAPSAFSSARGSAVLAMRPAISLRETFAANLTRSRQSAALGRFFAATAARDEFRTRDEAFLARRALDDAIATVRRGAVGELELSVVPAEVALKLTNLRLELLRGLGNTPAQRAVTREEIRAIEERYTEIWSRQTALQADKTRQMTLDLPAQQAREGLAKIALDSASAMGSRAATRRAVAAQVQNRLANDFAQRNDDLTLLLPATSQVPTLGSPPENALSGQDKQFFETPRDFPASSGALDAKSSSIALSRRFDGVLVARLKSQARNDARDWAHLVAARWGVRWNNAAGRPNRTGAAIEQLFSNAPRGPRKIDTRNGE